MEGKEQALREMMAEGPPLISEEEVAALRLLYPGQILQTQIFEWIEHSRVDEQLIAAVLSGHVSIKEWRDGEPIFVLSDAGTKRVEQMLKDRKESS